jgi:hypothetical protein
MFIAEIPFDFGPTFCCTVGGYYLRLGFDRLIPAREEVFPQGAPSSFARFLSRLF